MPFAAFRRHQKKLLAIFAILAMFGFVLSDSLYRFTSNDRNRGPNRVVTDLYDRPVYRSDLVDMANQRQLASRFFRNSGQFGGYSDRELVDALILKHEADRLGIPDSPEFAQGWLKAYTNGAMNKTLFESLLRDLGPEIGGSQVLAALASQFRLQEARRLTGGPVVTPLDVYQAYRDQNERSSFRFVAFPAANYLDKVPEPTAAEVESLYEKYKDVLPDPTRDTPGFKVPREVKLEVLTVDVNKLAKELKPKISEKELKAHYEANKSVYAIPPGTLPLDLFKGDPEAKKTPQLYQSFDKVKDILAETLAHEQAQEQVTERFSKIKDDEIDPFFENYQATVEANAEKKTGEPKPLPTPKSLADIAKANGMSHEVTPLLSFDKLKNYGQLGGAVLGSNASDRNEAKLADQLFAPKSPVYDSMEFSDPAGHRFLIRKLEDFAPREPKLSEVRPDVVAAWKLEKARALAEKAANELAEKIRKDGGTFKEEIVGGRPVVAIESVTKLRPGMPMGGTSFRFGPPSLAELPMIPNAGDHLRDELFGLKPGMVAVEPDTSKSTYYVFTLNRRDPASLNGLYAFPGPYQEEAFSTALRAEDKQRMDALRAQAGLKPDWVPPDEKDKDHVVAR
jgi:hypothetical protein